MKLLSLTYLSNIEWLGNLLFGGDCIIDLHEHYHKQSYRNRCEIMTAGGVVPLSVQVVRPDNRHKAAMYEVRIDYSKRWQHQHWNSIASAYRGAPYFDHYAPLFEPFYMRRFDLLADFNMQLLKTVLGALGVGVQLSLSEKYIEPGPGIEDLRDTISPKTAPAHRSSHFRPQKYYQTFADRQPFAPNLSIIDLLFCEGPGALYVIRGSYGGGNCGLRFLGDTFGTIRTLETLGTTY